MREQRCADHGHRDADAQHGGQDRELEWPSAWEEMQADRETEHEDRAEEHRVLDKQVRDHAARDDARRDPRPTERPDRQRDRSGAGRREQANCGDPGERYLDARAPVKARHATPEDGAKQQCVTADRGELGHGGDSKPRRVAAAQPAPGLLQTGKLREQEVKPDEHHEDHGDRHDDAPAPGHTGRRVVRARLELSFLMRSHRSP